MRLWRDVLPDLHSNRASFGARRDDRHFARCRSRRFKYRISYGSNGRSTVPSEYNATVTPINRANGFTMGLGPLSVRCIRMTASASRSFTVTENTMPRAEGKY